jgi:hypothetical protein
VIRNVRCGGYHQPGDTFAENSVALDTDAQLNYCTIIINAFEMAKGID